MIFNSVVPIVKNVIENVTDLFDLNLDTISGSIETVSNQGGGSEGNTNISVVENDLSLGEFDVNLDFDEVKYTSDFILSGFTDEVTFYDSASERITMDKELTPLQVTFPSGYIQSLKYNSVIKYDSKTVYLYDWTDGFNFPLIDYTDDGSSATLKMYAIYTESGKCEMVLLDKVMTDADLPTDFTAFLYIKDITIPSHTLFQRSLTSILDYNNPNFYTRGSVIISDGVASGFTSSSYLDSNINIPLSAASSFEIVVSMNLTNSYSNYAIIGNEADHPRSGGFVLRTTGSNRVYFWSTSNKSDWNISNYWDTWIDTRDGINYIKIVFTGSRYIFYYSTDGNTWEEKNSFNSTTPLADFYPRFGASANDIPLQGSLYLNETYFKINDEIAWVAYPTTYKWYCKEIKYDTAYTDKLPVNIWFNKAFYTQGGKYIESKNSYIIDYESDNENGCLIDYTDNGFGNLALHLYAVEFNDDDNYQLFLSDKTVVQLESYGNISDVEYIDDVVLQSHFNSEYINDEYVVKDQFQSFSYEDETTEPSKFIVLENEELGLIDSSTSPTNFEIQGNITITDGIAEGFTSSDYLYTSDFNFADATSTYEVVFKVLFTGDEEGYIWTQPVGNSYFGTLVSASRSSGYCLSGNDWDYNDLSWSGNWLEQNQWGYIKYTKDDSTYSLYTSLDNENWIYRSSFEWGNAIQNDGHAFTIGYSVNRGGPFPGKVDLKECYVKFGNEVVWTPYSNGNKVFENTELAPYDRVSIPYEAEDFTIIGSPILTNRIVSNFSFYNYIKLNTTAFRPQSDTWEIGGEITTGNDISTEQYFQGCCSNSDYKVPLIGVYQNKFRVLLSSSGSSWDICERTFGNDIATNTTYKFKLVFNGSSYELFVKGPSDADFVSYGHETTNAKIYDNTLYNISLGSNDYNSNQYFRGTINLNEWYYIVNDFVTWQPYKTEYNIETKGCLVNYTDDGSANTIKAYKVEYNDDSVYVVLTNDTDFTVTDMKSKTYLADIVIPEHETYHYGERDFIIDYENPDLSSGGTMGGVEEACQSDSYQDSSYYPWYAFNRDSGNQWRSQSVAGNHWITFYTPTPILLDKIDIKNFSDGNYTTFQYKVLVSNDNETWTELKSAVNLNNTGYDVWSISGFTNNTAVKYIRILSTKGFNANQVGFNKIYIYGHYITTGYGWILDDESSS